MDFCLIAESWFLDPQNWISMTKAIFGLGIVIFVHELGHFLVAKACGVKCEKFYVGFDVPITIGPIKLPAALWRYKWGETEYGIGMVPLGGYVKMLGQDDNPAHASAEAERIRSAKSQPDGDELAYQLDPRSYPAKTVPQRMAIISAGVVMNLIFAVIFGAAAYWMGVPYERAVVGRTVPGDSAWVNDLQYGDEFLQFDRTGRRDEHMRFFDLKLNIAAKHDARELEVLIRRPSGEPEERWVTLRSVVHEGEGLGLPSIGMSPQYSLKYTEFPPLGWTPAAKSGLKDGDVITHVGADGQSFPVDNSQTLHRLLDKFNSRPISLTVKRPGDAATDGGSSMTTTEQIKLPTKPYREYGMRMEMGPVSAVRENSPAEAAGFRPGDLLVAIDGQPIEDPLRVDDYFQPWIGKTVQVTVRRDGREQVLNVSPEVPQQSGLAWAVGRPMSSESIGVAYFVTDTIATIVPDGPARKAGLQAGDRITQAQFVYAPGAAVEESSFEQSQRDTIVPFPQEKHSWAGFIAEAEVWVPSGVDIELTYERGGTTATTRLSPTDSQELFDATRGLVFYPVLDIRKAKSFTDAWRLGWRETKESALQIVTTLKRMSKLWRHMGGPGSIVVAATQEASQGLPRLLTFLTLLSANLAVLNFMPIPVLDGGHMMFLLYEGVFGKPMPERVAFLATMVGLCFILSLMVFVIGMDVYRFLL